MVLLTMALLLWLYSPWLCLLWLYLLWQGFVELTRKPVDGPCVTEHASTAGAFVGLTSNCFLHALREEWTAVRRLPPLEA